MKSLNLNSLTDKEIIEGILINNPIIIEHFFFERCSKLFAYAATAVFGGKAKKEELLNELFLYLADNDWKKLRSFNFQSSLMTWINVVATRFFIKKRDAMIDLPTNETLNYIVSNETLADYISTDSLDIELTLDKLNNEKYRRVLRLIYVEDRPMEEIAKSLNITVANLYNLHRRALAKFRTLIL